MVRVIVTRLVQSILTLLIVLVIVFLLGRITGDPMSALLPLNATQAARDRIEAHWGLDRPLYEQFLVYLANAAKGDFGTSIFYPGQPAMQVVLERIPATLQLAAISLAFAVLLGIPIGVLSAVNRDTYGDTAGKIFALLGQSIPQFWVALVLMWIFGVTLRWLPVSGRGGFRHLILPAITLGWFQVSALTRLTRSAMLEAMDSEYIKLARIKGLPDWKVIWKHGLRNAAMIPLTYFGIILGTLMIGSVVAETIFTWPGTGRLALDAIRSRDFPLVQSVILVFAVIFILSNLIVDILYAWLDPRIRLGGRQRN